MPPDVSMLLAGKALSLVFNTIGIHTEEVVKLVVVSENVAS